MQDESNDGAFYRAPRSIQVVIDPNLGRDEIAGIPTEALERYFREVVAPQAEAYEAMKRREASERPDED